jgi:hypothetical protein
LHEDHTANLGLAKISSDRLGIEIAAARLVALTFGVPAPARYSRKV